MNVETIRNLLFGIDGADIPLRTISSMEKRGLLPDVYTEDSVFKWKNSFVGDFLIHNPNRHGVILNIKDAIGKMPSIEDFTETNLNKIVESFQRLSPNALRQVTSIIKSSITRLMESDNCTEVIPCSRYTKILTLSGCPTTKTYMNLNDLKKFMRYRPKNKKEEACHARFAVMLMTGARYSDVLSFKRTNIVDGVLTYVPKKTKFHGTVVTIPVSEQTAVFIDKIEETCSIYNETTFTNTLRDICRKCGLNEEVTYFWGGKYVTRPKWQAMRSHLGRTSFVTNMLKLGQQMHEVSKMAGHTDIAMTARYNASTDVELTKKANDFINMKF